jgi:hypothetical protein
MALLFKCSSANSFLSADVDPYSDEDSIQTIEIYIEDQEDNVGKSVYLDLNTAISLRKHLGREIGKLRNS